MLSYCRKKLVIYHGSCILNQAGNSVQYVYLCEMKRHDDTLMTLHFVLNPTRPNDLHDKDVLYLS